MEKNKISKLSQIEKMLTRRLLFLGVTMIFFGGFMFTCAIISLSYPSFGQDSLQTPEEMSQSSGFFVDLPMVGLTEKERKHSYAVAAIFGVIGTILIIKSKKKNRGMDEKENPNC